TNDLGKYFEVFILYKRVNKDTYQFIVDKVVTRVTLTKSILQALSIYVIQSTMLSKFIYIINRKCKNFIWGYTNEFRKIHMISWNSICSPKSHGGLGLKKISTINQAFMVKLG
ncbi:putative ribonuclease H protein, partial [Mucuna pruriens]